MDSYIDRSVSKPFTMEPTEELYSWYVVNCVFNVFLSYTAIMLNIAAIHAIRKTFPWSKPIKTLLLSLAVSDLGIGLTAQPLYVATVVMELKRTENTPDYRKIFTAFLVSANCFSFASCFLVVALISDRFFSIHFYLRYRELVTRNRVVAVAISIWVFNAILSLIRLWIPKRIIYVIFAIIYFVCVVTVIILNFKTYWKARAQINQIQEMELTVQQVAQNGEMINVARLRKFAMAAVYVCLVFLVCYLPNMCILWTIAMSGSQPSHVLIKHYIGTLVFLNSSLNPLIYCWKMRRIRVSVMNILRNVCSSHH